MADLLVELLETVAARWAIEEAFHDLKEVWGAEQQQVQTVGSSIGCWNLNGWLYTLVELASWDQPAPALVDRSDRLSPRSAATVERDAGIRRATSAPLA